MSVFDEDKVISEQFLIGQGFKKYRTGYYQQDYIRYMCNPDDSEYNERIIVNVFFSMKNNNIYVEKTMVYHYGGYWKYKVYDQLDFLSIISKYELINSKIK